MSSTATTGRRARGAGGILLLVGAVLFALVAAVAPVPVQAQNSTYYVGNTSGRPVTGTDATNCTDVANTTCTLRGALSLVTGVSSTVRFSSNIPAAPAQTTITLTDGGGGTITLPSVTINGTGKRVAISGGNSVRVFLINSPENTPVVTVTLAALTITGGNDGDLGGGINNRGGTVTLTGVTVSGNAANSGGGIHSVGRPAGGGGYACCGSITLVNSTVSDNRVTGQYGAGGGIFSNGASSMTLVNSTVSGNTDGGYFGSGNIYVVGGVETSNTIIAGGTSGSGNLFDDGNNLYGANPQLAPLGYYGGSTETMPPLPGSPAIDAGSNAVCAAAPVGGVDQRGVPRPQNTTCDIGAVEVVPGGLSLVVTRADADADDPNCQPAMRGGCTLRQAVNLANLAPPMAPTSTITFDMTVFNTAQTITLAPASGQLTLSRGVTITGPGANLLTVARSAAGGTPQFRIFQVNGGVTATIGGLTLTGGDAGGGDGGGIANYGNLTLTGSTASGNTASFGGGILNQDRGTTTLINSTVSGNTASVAGGIFTNLGTLTLTNSTVSGNTSGSGGGVAASSGTVTARNTIIAGNAGGDTSGTVTNVSSLIGGTVLLAPLGDYGGPTRTQPPLPGSPAIDAGDPTICAPLTTDQRGLSRPFPAGGQCDIGAVESRGFAFSSPTGGGQNTLVGTAFTSPLRVTVTGNTVATGITEPVSVTVGSVTAAGTVTFAITPGTSGASATFGSAATCTVTGNTVAICTIGTDGSVASPPFMANGMTGSFTIGATASGIASPTTFTEIIKATPTVQVASGSTMNTAAFGQGVTFTATVTGVNGAPPTGTVSFSYTPPGGTATPIGMAQPLAAGMAAGTATGSVSTSGLPVGADSITAVYSPGTDPNYTTANAAPITQTVTQASTSTALVAMPTTSIVGQSVTLTATVSVTAPGAGTPTGSVTFTRGGTTLGTGTVNAMGVATASTSALPVGASQTITAAYSGDGNFTPSSGTTSVTVNAVTITVTAPTGSGSGNSGTGSAPSIRAGSSITLRANPSTGVTYTSSNANVAAVDASTGVVTGISGGTATITASGPNGSTGTITVTVVTGTGTGLMAPAPAPVVHTGAVTAAPGATVPPQPMSHASGNSTGAGVGPQAVGGPIATPEAQPARH